MKEDPGGGKKLRNYMKLQICARMQRAEKKGQVEQELSILVAKIRHLGTLPLASGTAALPLRLPASLGQELRVLTSCSAEGGLCVQGGGGMWGAGTPELCGAQARL